MKDLKFLFDTKTQIYTLSQFGTIIRKEKINSSRPKNFEI